MSVGKQAGIKINQIMKKAPQRYQRDDYSKITIEKFMQLIPDSVPVMIKEDIALYFNYLRKNRSKKSLKKWEEISGCIESPSSYKVENYRPIFSFLYYDRITEGYFLPLILKKIETAFSSRSKEMQITEFNKLCRLSIIGFRPNIDNIDLKILQALSKEPSLVTQALTDKIEHSYATVYNHLQNLKAKMGLRIITRVNWTKLGIQRIFLISRNEKSFKPFEKYKKYLDGQASFLWGESYYLQYYLLNKQKRNEFLETYNSIPLPDKGLVTLYELTSTPLSGFSFDLYDLKDQKWEFDFATTFLDPKSAKNHDSLIEKRKLFKDSSIHDKPYELTEMEIKVVDGLVGSYAMSQKELADQLSIHAPNLSVLKTKLLNDDIIKPTLFIQSLLPLNLVLWCNAKDKNIIDTIIYLLQKIPFSNISPVQSYDDPKNHQIICYLMMDDVLYYSLVTFLLELVNENKLDDFRLGLTTDSYFGMGKLETVLK